MRKLKRTFQVSFLHQGTFLTMSIHCKIRTKNIKAVCGITDLYCLCSVSFKDDSNTKLLETITKEVKSSNPSFQAVHIRGKQKVPVFVHHAQNHFFAAAAYTYYRTLCREDSLQSRGIKNKRKVARRRRERITRVCTLA